ncbi:hypothetical protein F4677DRAFT_444223 [Hypoxylon crocopeplum]|nr:hypothetical protein F4677DRAFT_444223 [Hypoxylon crocopeplum]
MAGPTHHCPKASKGNCRPGGGHCQEHQVLCKENPIPTIKGQPCRSCIGKAKADYGLAREVECKKKEDEIQKKREKKKANKDLERKKLLKNKSKNQQSPSRPSMALSAISGSEAPLLSSHSPFPLLRRFRAHRWPNTTSYGLVYSLPSSLYLGEYDTVDPEESKDLESFENKEDPQGAKGSENEQGEPYKQDELYE